MSDKPSGTTPGVRLPFWRQMRWNLILYFVALAVLPVLIVVSITLNQTAQQARAQVFDQLNSVATLKTSQIEAWLQGVDADLELLLTDTDNYTQMVDLATAPTPDPAQQVAVGTYLSTAVVANPVFQEVFLYNPEGVIIAASDPVDVGKVVSQQPYFRPSLAVESRYLQAPYYDLATNLLTVVSTRVLRGPEGEAVAVLAARPNIATLGQIMTERAGLGLTGETYLVSNQNNYLLTPSRIPDTPLTQAYHSQGIDAATTGAAGSATYLNYEDPPVRVLGVYRWVPAVQAGLLAEISEAEALASVQLARSTSLLLAIAAAVIAVAIGYVTITRISQPVSALAGTAMRIAGGELSVRATVRTRNEVGVLASSFNSMADQLEGMINTLELRVQERTRDLEVAAEVAKQISAALDLDSLLSRMVELTKESFNLYHAHVYLIDEPTRSLVMEAGAGEAGRQMKQSGHRIPLAAEVSLVANAARSGQPVIANDVQSRPDHLPNPLLPDTRSEMAVPMLLGEKAIGVLDVQSDQVDRFTEADARVLTTLAGQVAVAVQNAHLFEQTGRSERLLRTVIDASPDWIWAKDEQFRFILINKAMAAQGMGTAPEDVVGKDDYPFFPAELIDGDPKRGIRGFHADDRAALAGESIHIPHDVVKFPDGSEHILDTLKTPLTDVSGRIIGSLGMGRDVTEREQRRRRQQTAYELGERLNSLLDTDQLLRETVARLGETFRYYHAHVYMYNEEGDRLVVREGLGEAGKILKEMGHSIPLQAERSLVARAGRTLEPVVINDVSLSAEHLPNPLLPETRSEVALPLFTGNRLLGVLDVQHSTIEQFDDDEVQTLRIIAGQLAVSLSNARLFAETQDALAKTAALQARLEAIIDAANSAIVSVDKARGVILFNRAAEGVFGYTAAEAIGKPLETLMLDAEEMLAAVPRAGGGEVVTFTCRRKNGSEFPAEGSFAWVELEDEMALTAVFNDISERRRVERRERLAYELGQDLTVLFNPDLLLRETINRLGEALGYYHAHIYLLDEAGERLVVREGLGDAGQTLKEMGHSIPLYAEHSLVAAAARQAAPVIVNDVTTSPDHLPNPLLPETRSEAAIPLYSGERLLGVLDVQHNVLGTFSEPEVRTLRVVSNQLAIALSNAQLYQEQLDARARAERINRDLALLNRVIEAASATLNRIDMLKAVCYELAMSFGAPQATAWLLNDERTEGTAVAEYLAAGRPSALGATLPVVGNSALEPLVRSKRPVVLSDPGEMERGIVSVLVVPLIVEGDAVGMVGLEYLEPRSFSEDEIALARNVAAATSQALFNAQLYEQQIANAERLRDLDRLKSEFLATMSHELRTPLNSIIGYSELLIDEMGPSMDEMSFEDLKAIHSSGQHLLSIINDILDLAKIEAGRLELNRTKVDFVGLAGQVTESARVLLKDKPEVELEMDIPADLPPIEADSVRLRQVLWNLLSNAIKFTEQGSVELLAVVEDNTLRVAVKDTGIGIAPQYQTLIFDQFRQADGSTTRRAGGTGLGLAITRQLVLLHGGDIQVESVLGKGSTFIVTLPLTPPRHHRARDTGELTSPVETEAAEAPGD